jgi:Icc-related predicted phosphoesterase
MKIIAISDTHCRLHEVDVPDGDVLVHAGDLTFRGDVHELTQELSALAALPHKHKIIIAGNHDWLFQREGQKARDLAKAFGLTYLQDSGITIDDVKFYGSPWQPEFGNWAFNLSRLDTELKDKWAAIPGDTNVLVTHGPPQHRLDKTVGRYIVYGGQEMYEPGENVGCYDLARRLTELKELRLHIFGHIHSGAGQEKGADGVTYVNASICTEEYLPINKPIVFEYDTNKQA